MHVINYIAEIQKGQGLGSGYEWLAGLVSRVCMAGIVFRVCMGGLNISGVQISRDRPFRGQINIQLLGG